MIPFFVFSGQGAQFAGMGKDLAENSAAAKAIFDMFYNPNANITDVREFCKRLECWEETKKISFDFSIASRELLS